MSAAIDSVITTAKHRTFEVMARPGAFQWTEIQKLGEFVTQLRRATTEETSRLSRTELQQLNDLCKTEKWHSIGTLKEDLPPVPELTSIGTMVGHLGFLTKQMTELSHHSEVTVNRIINMNKE